MEQQSSVQSLDRAFLLLDLVSRSPEGITLAEVVAQSGLHKSTVYRLLAALSELGYIRKEEGGRYRMTLKLFRIAGRAVDDLDLVKVAQPFLDRLNAETTEAVHLVVPEGSDIVYVRKVEDSGFSVRMLSRIGARRAMYCTAVGKSLMARMSDEQVAALWAQSEIREYTPYTTTDLNAFLEELEEIRRRGYAVDNEENELGVRCVAACVVDHRGVGVGALSVSAPLQRMDDERVRQIAVRVCAAARELSIQLGSREE